jgi:hypothetical protein
LSQLAILFKNGDLAQRVEALVLSAIGGVAVGRGFEPQSDLEVFSAKMI